MSADGVPAPVGGEGPGPVAGVPNGDLPAAGAPGADSRPAGVPGGDAPAAGVPGGDLPVAEVPGGDAPAAGVPGGDVPVAAVLASLRRRGQTLAVAESLTGGLLATTIVDVPGASTVFRGGLVVYATDLKATLAGVDAGLLAERGPVDPDVAAALAAGASERCGADWGLATTGVAGPGAQDGLPAGTVYIGLHGPGGEGAVRRLALAGDRATIRRATVAAALALLAERAS